MIIGSTERTLNRSNRFGDKSGRILKMPPWFVGCRAANPVNHIEAVQRTWSNVTKKSNGRSRYSLVRDLGEAIANGRREKPNLVVLCN